MYPRTVPVVYPFSPVTDASSCGWRPLLHLSVQAASAESLGTELYALCATPVVTVGAYIHSIMMARMPRTFRWGRKRLPIQREIIEPTGDRYAVLDVIIEVPVEKQTGWEDIGWVLGFDWGVRVLVTASVVDRDGIQIRRPFFLDTGPFDGQQARTRRQIDHLNAKVQRLEQQRDRFGTGAAWGCWQGA